MKYIIDTDKLPCNNGKNCTTCPFWSIDDTCEINEQVKQLPKYEERTHGVWLYHKPSKCFSCSKCHYRIEGNDDGWNRIVDYFYCPKCGTIMDER